jgi:hypothetical protein
MSASAVSQTLNGNLLESSSAALSPFGFSAVRSSIALTPAATDSYWATTARTTLGVAEPDEGVLSGPGTGEALLFAAPDTGDAASWLEGNTDALAVGLPVLALGAVAGSASAGDGSRFAGRLELELATSFFDGELALAFLDPSARGSGFDVLELSFSREGTVVFERTYTDTATALAELDDAVIDLGGFLASDGELLSLVLDYALVLDDTAAASGFAFDLALLGTTPSPVPEPGLAPLALVGLVVISALRRARTR